MKHIKVPIRRLTKLSTRRITMSKASKARQLMTLCMSMLLVIAGSVIVTPTASANEVNAKVFSAPGWDYANTRNGPGTMYTVLGTVSAGAQIKLGCWSPGGEAKGPYGKSTIWYRVIGRSGYISDAMVYTGSDDPVTQKCSNTLAPPNSYNREAAANWATANVYGDHRYSDRQGGDCTWFASQALWAGSVPQTRDWTSDPEFGSDEPPRSARVADDFKNYLVNESAFATIKELSWTQNDVPEAELGDLIVYDLHGPKEQAGADGVIDHVMVITKFSGQYPEVSGHTADVENHGWTHSQYFNTWMEKAYPGARVYLIHITY